MQSSDIGLSTWNQAIEMSPAPSSQSEEKQSLLTLAAQQCLSELADPMRSLGKARRKRTKYSANITVSWSFDSRLRDRSNRNWDDTLEERVIHHAYVRVQILFHLFVLYWNENCEIQRGATFLQHGIRTVQNMSAAHSSILPNIQDDFFAKLNAQIALEGYSEQVQATLMRLGYSIQEIEEDKKGELSFERKSLIPRGSALCEAMSSTVELPLSVNEYDTLFEEKASMRDRALELLNQASKGELHPLSATRKFVSSMQDFFIRSRREIMGKMTLLRRVAKLQGRLIETERFVKKNAEFPSDTPVECYLELLSEVEQLAEKIHSSNRFSPKVTLSNPLPSHKELILAIKKSHKISSAAFAEELILGVTELMPWHPFEMGAEIHMLEESLKINIWQSKGTATPETREPLEESEILAIKSEIIRRE